MTRTLRMNSNRDIFAVNGVLQVAIGLDAVLQTCERAAKAVRGEMVYATDRGVRYFRDVFGASVNVIRFEADLRAQIMRVHGVVAIESFSVQINKNVLTYSIEIRTVYGTSSIEDSM